MDCAKSEGPCDICKLKTTKNKPIRYIHRKLRICNNCRPNNHDEVIKNINIGIKCFICKTFSKAIVINNKQFICKWCNDGYIKCSHYTCDERSYWMKMKNNEPLCKYHY